MKKFLISVLILLLLLAMLIGAVFYTFEKINHSKDGTVHIFEGANSKQIAESLEQDGIIKDADYFYYYIKAKIWYEKTIKKNFKEENYNFKQGDYKLENGDFNTIIKQLVEGENDPQTVSVTFPEGITIGDMTMILEEAQIIKRDDFLAYISQPEVYAQFKEKYPWLPTPVQGVRHRFEGYLMTTTYLFPKNEPFATDASLIVEKMLEETNRWYRQYADEVEASNYTFSEIMTLASIVEKEAKFEKDRPIIARVFYNRLKIGMKLQSDMTAAYANGKHKVFMYYKDIRTKSPYNTYYVQGLPVGPIAFPSESSFLAALNPAGEENQYLYFYARPSGESFYAVTPQQHAQNIKAYEHEWKALEKQQNTSTGN